MEITQSFIDNSIRHLLIELFYPYIKAADFLPEEYDKAIKGITYRPDSGHNINYDYSSVISILNKQINNSSVIKELSKLMKNKPSTVVSTDFQNIPEDIVKDTPQHKEKDTEEQLYLSEDIEKIASETLNPDSDCANGKTFITEEGVDV